MKTRKQVYELTPDDLEKNPIWEFALDEEVGEDQDEATVMPIDQFDEVSGLFIIKGEFKAANGIRYVGYLNLSETDAGGGASLDQMQYVQPVIVTDEGQIGFWNGTLDLDKEELAGVYEMREIGRYANRSFGR